MANSSRSRHHSNTTNGTSTTQGEPNLDAPPAGAGNPGKRRRYDEDDIVERTYKFILVDDMNQIRKQLAHTSDSIRDHDWELKRIGKIQAQSKNLSPRIKVLEKAEEARGEAMAKLEGRIAALECGYKHCEQRLRELGDVRPLYEQLRAAFEESKSAAGDNVSALGERLDGLDSSLGDEISDLSRQLKEKSKLLDSVREQMQLIRSARMGKPSSASQAKDQAKRSTERVDVLRSPTKTDLLAAPRSRPTEENEPPQPVVTREPPGPAEADSISAATAVPRKQPLNPRRYTHGANHDTQQPAEGNESLQSQGQSTAPLPADASLKQTSQPEKGGKPKRTRRPSSSRMASFQAHVRSWRREYERSKPDSDQQFMWSFFALMEDEEISRFIQEELAKTYPAAVKRRKARWTGAGVRIITMQKAIKWSHLVDVIKRADYSGKFK